MGTQVLVTGAGPVGLFMAASLARLGLAVRIVDKAPAPSDRSKALVIWPRTLEMLDIQGCADVLVHAGLKVTRAHIMASGRTIAAVSLASAPSPFPYALFLPQDETERLLDAELRRLGVAVERSVELLGFDQDADGVAARLGRADGTTETLRVDWLVGCDGAHSTIRHALNLPFAGTTEPSDWLLADVMLDGPAAMEVLICWHADGVLALFPITPGRFRVVADRGAAGGPAAGEAAAAPTLADVQSVLDRRGPGGLTARDPVWLTNFRINERKVADYRVGRAFLAGDAAHIHSPAGGQGMNTGMQDAANLAWKVALVSHGRAGAGLLDSYSPERSAIGDQVLRNAGRMTRVATLRNPWLQAVRDTVGGVLGGIEAVRERFAATMTELDLHYPESPLNGPAGGSSGLAPGDRVPDGPVRTAAGATARMAEQLRDGRFLVVTAPDPGQAPAPLALPDSLADLATSAVAAGGSLRPGHHYVVRPDAYLAMAAAVSESGSVLTYLKDIARP